MDEITPLVGASHLHAGYGYGPQAHHRHNVGTAASILSSHLSRDELALGDTAIGERLPSNAYTTIDWLHDLVRSTRNKPAIRQTAVTNSLIR